MTKETNKNIIVYGISGGYCGYCDQAKELLENKDLEYKFVEATESEEFATNFVSKGFKSVPQIVIDDTHIGGYSDLVVYFRQAEGGFDVTD